MTTKQYTLKEAREELGMTKRDLSRESGISMAAINAVENGSAYKTSEGVAKALAEALALEVHEIAWPRGLSHLGRPAKSGKPIIIRRTVTYSMTEEVSITSDDPICPKHFTTYPRSGNCDLCE